MKFAFFMLMIVSGSTSVAYAADAVADSGLKQSLKQTSSSTFLSFDVALAEVAASAKTASLFCTMDALPHAFRWVAGQSNDQDKFKHCAVSCYLALRCNATEVWMVGALKEFKDLFDDGNAEIADLRADEYGIALATGGIADQDSACANRCNVRFNMGIR